MTKEKWTPGPWHVGPKKATYQVVGDVAERLIELGLPTEIEMASVGHRGGQAAAIPMDESSMANAHLISAAPELLEACERVIDSIEGGATTPEESITYVRAAIAKARGERRDTRTKQ